MAVKKAVPKWKKFLTNQKEISVSKKIVIISLSVFVAAVLTGLILAAAGVEVFTGSNVYKLSSTYYNVTNGCSNNLFVGNNTAAEATSFTGSGHPACVSLVQCSSSYPGICHTSTDPCSSYNCAGTCTSLGSGTQCTNPYGTAACNSFTTTQTSCGTFTCGTCGTFSSGEYASSGCGYQGAYACYYTCAGAETGSTSASSCSMYYNNNGVCGDYYTNALPTCTYWHACSPSGASSGTCNVQYAAASCTYYYDCTGSCSATSSSSTCTNP